MQRNLIFTLVVELEFSRLSSDNLPISLLIECGV